MKSYYGLGRRKCAVAKVFISQSSKNEIFINGILISMPMPHMHQMLSGPFRTKILVSGGGQKGQKEAIILALARAISQMGSRAQVQNFLTQDARVKERKKYGLKKARKAPQYSKR